MRHFLPFAFLLFSSIAFSQITKTYTANGKSSFGGAVGGGSLSITDIKDSIYFTLTKGPGTFDDILVFYIDREPGGITSTVNLPGSLDPYAVAVTGLNSTVGQRAVLNFGAGFEPEGAIAFNKDGGKVYSFLSNIFGPGSVLMLEVSSFSITPSGTNSAPQYTHKSLKSNLGLTSIPNFKFLGTYISATGSRSNESFGDPFTNYARVARTTSYASYTTSGFYTFSPTLPVKLIDFKAVKETDGINISWSVAQESNIEFYEVQRSANGVQFSTVQTVAARNSDLPSSYSAKDRNPNAKGNYYRLGIRENGKTEYSKVVYISSDKTKIYFAANYQSGNILTLSLYGIEAGAYKLSVISSNGQMIHTESLQHNGANQVKQINLRQIASKAIYKVVLESTSNRYQASILTQ